MLHIEDYMYICTYVYVTDEYMYYVTQEVDDILLQICTSANSFIPVIYFNQTSLVSVTPAENTYVHMYYGYSIYNIDYIYSTTDIHMYIYIFYSIKCWQDQMLANLVI